MRSSKGRRYFSRRLTILEQRLVAMEAELEERLIRREENLRRFLKHLWL
jgi:hypothetical protein